MTVKLTPCLRETLIALKKCSNGEPVSSGSVGVKAGREYCASPWASPKLNTLVRMKLAKRAGKGMYEITDKGLELAK